MNQDWNMEYLNVMVDMAGCPNRCRHCWLGSHKNGSMSTQDFREIAAQFKDWRDESGRGIGELGFFSWWREPDFREDYRELWRLEQELSSPGRAERFELLSVWRLARDEPYAKWAATLPPKACQISFFGMEENTDWGVRRKGAFRDSLLATERLLAAGIAPRWQLFLTQRCLGELDDFLRLMEALGLHRRCEDIGRKFEVFIGGISPEGNGWEIDGLRIDAAGAARIPQALIDLCREGTELLGEPEAVLMEELLQNDTPPEVQANMKSVSVNADFDVYPNIAEPAEWWRLGSLKTDGVDAVLRAYRDETTPGMRMNREIPLRELARRYGSKNSQKLYDREDLISRFLHQWGEDYLKGKQ